MKDLVYFDPLLFKSPKGVITKNVKVNFKVNIQKEFIFKEIFLLVKKDDENFYKEKKMNQNGDFFSCDYEFHESGHFWYNFKIVTEEEDLFLNKTYENFSALENFHGEDFFQSVIEKEYKIDNSMQGGLIYQIFVDRFCKVGDVKCREPLIFRDDWGGALHKNTTNPILINQEVFGGNIKGVISKLDYLQNLGVTTIYLNPIGLANSNHKYDTADYGQIDSMYGTEEEFKKLIKLADEKQIKIVIDGVYNHTGSDSIYFNKNSRFDSLGAFESKESKYYDWYNFDNWPNKYKCWWGIDTLPAIRDDCSEFEKYIAGKNGIIEKFMKMGVFGVRLDVVDEIDDEFVKRISNKVNEFGANRVVMGEVWEDASTKMSYGKRRKYFSNNELNSVMNYPIKESILNYAKTKDPRDLVSTIRMIQNNYPEAVQHNLMNFLGTHDTNRILSELELITNGNRKQAIKLLKICFCLVFTMVGVPSIFYGDEYGMENNDGSSRGCFDEKNCNNEIFEFVKKLTKIRKLDVMKDGEINILMAQNGKFVYERIGKREHVVVLTNLKNSPLQVTFDKKFKSFFEKKLQNSFILGENEFEILIETR